MRSYPTAELDVVLDLTPLHLIVEMLQEDQSCGGLSAWAKGEKLAFQWANA